MFKISHGTLDDKRADSDAKMRSGSLVDGSELNRALSFIKQKVLIKFGGR